MKSLTSLCISINYFSLQSIMSSFINSRNGLFFSQPSSHGLRNGVSLEISDQNIILHPSPFQPNPFRSLPPIFFSKPRSTIVGKVNTLGQIVQTRNMFFRPQWIKHSRLQEHTHPYISLYIPARNLINQVRLI